MPGDKGRNKNFGETELIARRHEAVPTLVSCWIDCMDYAKLIRSEITDLLVDME